MAITNVSSRQGLCGVGPHRRQSADRRSAGGLGPARVLAIVALSMAALAQGGGGGGGRLRIGKGFLHVLFADLSVRPCVRPSRQSSPSHNQRGSLCPAAHTRARGTTTEQDLTASASEFRCRVTTKKLVSPLPLSFSECRQGAFTKGSWDEKRGRKGA
jgi:hypothetical protein